MAMSHHFKVSAFLNLKREPLLALAHSEPKALASISTGAPAPKVTNIAISGRKHLRPSWAAHPRAIAGGAEGRRGAGASRGRPPKRRTAQPAESRLDFQAPD